MEPRLELLLVLWMAESMAYVLAATVNGDLNLDSLYYKIMSFIIKRMLVFLHQL